MKAGAKSKADPQDILRRRALEYHQREDRSSSCGSMALDMDLILNGLVEIGLDARLHVTNQGRALLAKADRNPKGGDAKQAPSQSDESSGRAAICPNDTGV